MTLSSNKLEENISYFTCIVDNDMYFSHFQAQRDYFGAHTYELLDSPGKFIHTNWTGHGGNVSSTTYIEQILLYISQCFLTKFINNNMTLSSNKLEENISKTITIILYEDQDCLDN
jgi:hypothetical protein